MINILKNQFKTLFNSNPLLVKAPGRINLIGEHTDYNDGYVLPAAIDKSIYFAVSTNDKNTLNLISYDLNDNLIIPLNEIKISNKQWANYLLGIINSIHKRGYSIKGVNCIFGGNIPIGAGLSSSAALSTGFAFAINEIFNLGLSKKDIAKISQEAEHDYAGVKCGIMDQFASLFGQKDKVLKLDCRTLNYEYFPIIQDTYEIILCNTMIKHSLASSEYNKRRLECENGVKILKQHYPGIINLRDVNIDMLNEHKKEIDRVIFNRCKYVIEENRRVLSACESLSKNDLESFGSLMYETHNGLRYDYEVSCMELDILVDLAKKSGLVIGSRVMGGGFGGCTINILEKNNKEKFINTASKTFLEKIHKELQIHEVCIENGTSIV